MPHLGAIVSLILKSCCRCCDRGCSCKGIKTKKKLRKKYFELYVGPEFDIDSRYATTLSYFYIVMVLGSGMPILYFLFSLYLLLSFIIDKALTIKYYKTPPKYGLNINNTFISFSFSGIALHFLIAIWIFGNPSFMSGKLMTDKGFLNKLKQRIINETTQIIVLNVLITLLFVIVYLIIKKINENSRNKFDDLFHSNLSIDELLTEDVMN